MNAYERRCRRLLRLWPAVLREERGEETMAIVLDDAPPTGSWPSPALVLDLALMPVRAGARRSISGSAGEYLGETARLAAVLGVTVQTGFAVFVAEERRRTGMVGHLPDNASAPTTFWLLAGAWVLALVLLVRGRDRLALVPAVGAAFVTTVFTVSTARSGMYDAGAAWAYAMLAVVPTLALLAAAPTAAGRSRSIAWLGLAGALAAALVSTIGGGSAGVVRLPGGGIGVEMEYGIVKGGSTVSPELVLIMAVGLVCLAALLLGRIDPRLGPATLVVAVPVLALRAQHRWFGMCSTSGCLRRGLPPWLEITPLVVVAAFLLVNSVDARMRARRLV